MSRKKCARDLFRLLLRYEDARKGTRIAPRDVTTPRKFLRAENLEGRRDPYIQLGALFAARRDYIA